ncbi:hypothetical protein SPHINGO361_140017 [Sphingomonas sp. EC-HK361]|uniref:hypothetical protein n=1 Tax=Sphingomonas sp. EC-HK361 TaxID=2038397 RepID=UPI0012511AF8|nr:hypothetical protein [Sphingomonas sp. EC-HK361]VVT16343.1 hypothetical protein SPHINGO361_140017 [Sphingomonas sp. EC-HK361]
MDPNALLRDPIFGIDDLVTLTREPLHIEVAKSWVKHGHIKPVHVDGRRRFSAIQLLHADLVGLLAFTMKVPPSIGSAIADNAIAEYDSIEGDFLEVFNGKHFAAPPASGGNGKMTFNLVRTPGDILRPWQPGDREEDGVMIVLPVALVARGLFAKMRVLIEARSIGVGS